MTRARAYKTMPPLLVTGGGYLDRGTVTSAGASRGPARRGCRQRTLSGVATEGSVANSRGDPARATPLQPARCHNRNCGARDGRAGPRADLGRGQLQPAPRPARPRLRTTLGSWCALHTLPASTTRSAHRMEPLRGEVLAGAAPAVAGPPVQAT